MSPPPTGRERVRQMRWLASISIVLFTVSYLGGTIETTEYVLIVAAMGCVCWQMGRLFDREITPIRREPANDRKSNDTPDNT